MATTTTATTDTHTRTSHVHSPHARSSLHITPPPTQDEKNYRDQLVVGDLTAGLTPLDHMARVAQEIYLPLITNPRNQEVWSEMVLKEVVESVNGFMANVQITQGQVEGMTCLPLPPDSDLMEVGSI